MRVTININQEELDRLYAESNSKIVKEFFIELGANPNADGFSIYDIITMTPDQAWFSLYNEILSKSSNIELVNSILEHSAIDINQAHKVSEKGKPRMLTDLASINNKFDILLALFKMPTLDKDKHKLHVLTKDFFVRAWTKADSIDEYKRNKKFMKFCIDENLVDNDFVKEVASYLPRYFNNQQYWIQYYMRENAIRILVTLFPNTTFDKNTAFDKSNIFDYLRFMDDNCPKECKKNLLSHPMYKECIKKTKKAEVS